MQSFMIFHVVFLHASLIFHATDSLPAIMHDEQAQALWTWIGGNDHKNQHTTQNGSRVYPGSRNGAASWCDSNVTVWMFGGKGFGAKKIISSTAAHVG